jgi:predicted RNA-binding Zn-ribbon protein involved in translation (DUF1610 family)
VSEHCPWHLCLVTFGEHCERCAEDLVPSDNVPLYPCVRCGERLTWRGDEGVCEACRGRLT